MNSNDAIRRAISFFFLLSILIIASLSNIKFENGALGQTHEQANRNYSYFLKWGSFGKGDGEFLSPHGIAVDSFGNVYVSDRDRNDVQKFTDNGTFIKKWGKNGTGPGEFNHPYEIRIDTYDNLYVVDKFNNRIQVFDTNGTFIRMHSSVGNSNITFNSPEALAVDPLGAVMYIADTGNNRIVKVSHDFDFINQWGKNGTGPGEFTHPHGIDLDSSGNVFVNELNPRIQKFDSNGNFVSQWGEEGDGHGQFAPHLEHLFIDSSDNVWQVDGEENSRIVNFDTDGNYITTVGSGPCVIHEEVTSDKIKMSGPLPCDGKLNGPEHVTVDLSGNLLVVDRFNYRIVGYKAIANASQSINDGSCWTRGEDMPTSRIEMASAKVDDKIYVIGGYTDKTTNIVEVYDTIKDEWGIIPPLPKKLDHAAAATYNNKIYVVGGFDEGSKPSNRLFIYDTLLGKWEVGKNMPTARGALTAEFINGLLYAIGGDTGASYIEAYHPYGQTNTNEAYDPATDSWQVKAPMPTARHHHSSAVVGEKLYVIGGRYGLADTKHIFNNTDANEQYNPVQNNWYAVKPTPTDRSGTAATSINGSIYVFGGETKNYPSETQHTYAENEKYDASTNSWMAGESMSTGKHGLIAEAVNNKIFVIGGGKKPGFTVDNTTEIYHMGLEKNSCI